VKILHTSDWHVGRRIRGRDRSDEHRAVLAELVTIAAGAEVQLVVVAGDVFDMSAPTPAAEQIVWRGLLDLAEVAPVVVIAGNHDNPGRLEAVAPLLELGRIVVCSEPSPPDQAGVMAYEELGIKVAMLPFVSQRGIVRAEQIMGSDPDQHAGAYEERIKRLIEALTASMTPDTVNLLAGHLTVHGAQEGGGERQAHIFGYAVPASVFPGHLSHVALGHLHRQQKVPHGGSVWYSGSPLQLDFGEVDDRKGALLVEASPGLPSKVTAVPLTSGRRLVTLRGTLEQVLAHADDVEGAYVKVELTEKARVGLADTVRTAIPGAVDVTLLKPAPARSQTIESRRAISPTDAFHRYLEDNNVGDERVEALFAELFDEATA
jgi:DNA repair protein SbcD/Mre11